MGPDPVGVRLSITLAVMRRSYDGHRLPGLWSPGRGRWGTGRANPGPSPVPQAGNNGRAPGGRPYRWGVGFLTTRVQGRTEPHVTTVASKLARRLSTRRTPGQPASSNSRVYW